MTYHARTDRHQYERKTQSLSNVSQNENQDESQHHHHVVQLHRRELAEIQHNAETLKDLASGRINDCITYGSTIQLQHMTSHLFMAIHKKAAPSDAARHKIRFVGPLPYQRLVWVYSLICTIHWSFIQPERRLLGGSCPAPPAVQDSHARIVHIRQ